MGKGGGGKRGIMEVRGGAKRTSRVGLRRGGMGWDGMGWEESMGGAGVLDCVGRSERDVEGDVSVNVI